MPSEKDTPAGRLAVAILVAQDLAVVPLLLITSALGTAMTSRPWSTVGVKMVIWRWRCWPAFIACAQQDQKLPLSRRRNIC